MAAIQIERPQQEEDKLFQAQTDIGNEIDCPRCSDVMVLCSEFDTLYYQCEECDFVLYLVENAALGSM